MSVTTTTGGRHFLQIPGPTNVPDRVLRAMARPDHRPPRPGVRRARPGGARGGQAGLRHQPSRSSSTRPRAPAPGRRRWSTRCRPGDTVLASRPGTSPRCGRRWPPGWGCEVEFVPGDWRHGADPQAVAGAAGGRHRARDQGRDGGPQRDLHRRHQPGRRRSGPRIDAADHPALLLVDTISSLGSDRLPARRVGRGRHRRRLAEGAHAAARAELQRGQREGARRRSRPRGCPGPSGTGSRSWPPTSAASGPTRRPPTCSTALREALTMLNEEGLRAASSRAHQRHAEATRAAVRGWGLEVLAPRRAGVLRFPDRDPACPTATPTPCARSSCESYDMSLGAGLGKLAGQGLPHRPPRPLQRPDAGRHPRRRADGAGPGRGADRPHRHPGRPRAPAAAVTGGARAPSSACRGGLERELDPGARRRGRLRRLHPAPVQPGRQHVRDDAARAWSIPAHADDVAATVRLAGEAGVPVLARGAGTSLAGQTVGPGLVLDLSRHMHRIVELDPEARTARVAARRRAGRAQPGRRPARADVRARHLDVSNRATIGGMIGNNSAGSGSVRYGMTIDHVRELDVVLADGVDGAPSACVDEAERARRARGRHPGGPRSTGGCRELVAEHADGDRHRLPAVLAPGRRLPAGPAGRRAAVRPGDVPGRLGGDAGDRHRGRGRPGAQAAAHGVRGRALHARCRRAIDATEDALSLRPGARSS